MKRDGLTHPRLYDLASRLSVPRTQAIGILELLWSFTATHASAGDIGRYPDSTLAGVCDWPDDPSVFVRHLVETGWLEDHSAHRLIVHDWSEHAAGFVRAKLKRSGKGFVTSEHSIVPSLERASEPSREATILVQSSLVKPSQVLEGKPSRDGSRDKSAQVRESKPRAEPGLPPGPLGDKIKALAAKVGGGN